MIWGAFSNFLVQEEEVNEQEEENIDVDVEKDVDIDVTDKEEVDVPIIEVAPAGKPSLDWEVNNVNFDSKNKFSFEIDNKLDLKNFILNSDINIDQLKYKQPIFLKEYFSNINEIIMVTASEKSMTR